MADMPSFPLDGSKGAKRVAIAIGFAAMTLVYGTVMLYMLWNCLAAPFRYKNGWEIPLFFLPGAMVMLWFIGLFALNLDRMYTRVVLSEAGVTLQRPLRRARRCPWSEFQQVCICYSSAVPGKNDGVSVICFVRHGEKKNLYDRWKTDNPWHYHRLIVADHTADLEEAVRAVCPMEIKDLRGSIAYPDPEK